MRPARLIEAGLALLAVALLAVRADSFAPQDAADPVLEADFVLTGREHHSRGAAEVRVRSDGAVTVSVSTHGPKPLPPAHVEQYRLSVEELRALAALVRKVDFFGAPEPESETPWTHWGGPTLRVSLDGTSLERKNVGGPGLGPLASWFHRFVEQTRLLRELRNGPGILEVAQALRHDSHQVARRSDFRAPLLEFAEKCTDPKVLLVAIGALAPLEEPGPWGALVLRRAAVLDADAEFTLVDLVLRGCWEAEGRVTEAHRATLFARALELVRTRARGWADLPNGQRDTANYVVGVLARSRYEPLFAALPELAREGAGPDRPLRLPFDSWGERGFDAAMGLLSAPDPVVQRSAIRVMPVFLYQVTGRYADEHPVPAEERARVRARLLSEGVARLDALGEDAAMGREGRKAARDQAGEIRRSSAWEPPRPRAPEPKSPPQPVKSAEIPPGVSIEVIGVDDGPLPGVRVRGVNTSADRRPATDGPPPSATAVSDRSGIAVFGELSGRDWEFDVDHPGLVRVGVTRLSNFEGMRVRQRLRVRARQVLSGRLVGNSGRPLVGVAVRRLRADGTPHEEDAEVRTNELGRVSLVEIRNREPGRLLVGLADGRTLTLEERFLSDGRDWGVDFGPEGDGVEEPSIRGRVVGTDGEGLPSTVVAVTSDPPPGRTSDPVSTRRDGTFEIYGLAPGVYRLWANHRGPGGSIRGGAAGFADVAEVPTRGVTITIRIGGRISGRVVDPDGKAVAGLRLIANLRESAGVSGATGHPSPALPPPGRLQAAASTDQDGRFVLDDLRDGEFEFTAGSGSPYWLDRRVAVRPGGEPATLHAVPAVPLEGTVVTKDGITLRGVKVIAVRLPGGDHRCQARSGAEGAFVLKGADPASSYELFADFEHVADNETPLATVAPGERTVRLVADPGAVGTVVVKDRFGEPASGMQLRLRHETRKDYFERSCDRGGEFHLPYRLEGRWSVERSGPKRGRETVLGTVESGVLGQVITLPEEWE